MSNLDKNDYLFLALVLSLVLFPLPSLFWFGSIPAIVLTGFTGLFALFVAKPLFGSTRSNTVEDIAFIFTCLFGLGSLFIFACHTFSAMANS